jgi:hypothetical protein
MGWGSDAPMHETAQRNHEARNNWKLKRRERPFSAPIVINNRDANVVYQVGMTMNGGISGLRFSAVLLLALTLLSPIAAPSPDMGEEICDTPVIYSPGEGSTLFGSVLVQWYGVKDFEDSWLVACDRDGIYPFDYNIGLFGAYSDTFTTWWSCNWNTALVPNGNWLLIVVEAGPFSIGAEPASIHVTLANPDATPPSHSADSPNQYSRSRTPTISTVVTDASGIDLTTVHIWLDGAEVPYAHSPVSNGYSISHSVVEPLAEGQAVLCRVRAEDPSGNALDFTWSFTVLHSFSMALEPGWNLISIPLVQVDSTVEASLSTIAGKWSSVMAYDRFSSDPWKVNSAARHDALDDLKALNHKAGYWINYMDTMGGNLTVYGLLPGTTTISLRSGWNLVGYPTSREGTSVSVELWGTGADAVEAFDAGAPYHLASVDAAHPMAPGEGYWVHVQTDATWTIAY